MKRFYQRFDSRFVAIALCGALATELCIARPVCDYRLGDTFVSSSVVPESAFDLHSGDPNINIDVTQSPLEWMPFSRHRAEGASDRNCLQQAWIAALYQDGDFLETLVHTYHQEFDDERAWLYQLTEMGGQVADVALMRPSGSCDEDGPFELRLPGTYSYFEEETIATFDFFGVQADLLVTLQGTESVDVFKSICDRSGFFEGQVDDVMAISGQVDIRFGDTSAPAATANPDAVARLEASGILGGGLITAEMEIGGDVVEGVVTFLPADVSFRLRTSFPGQEEESILPDESFTLLQQSNDLVQLFP